jgi:hypothetical protein
MSLRVSSGRPAAFVDLAHAAFAKLCEELIRAEFLPDHVLASLATASLRSALIRDERRTMARTEACLKRSISQSAD